MSKNTNLSFLTDYITADITNGRIGINNASPTVAFDVTGATKITGVLTLTSTISNGTYAYLLNGNTDHSVQAKSVVLPIEDAKVIIGNFCFTINPQDSE